MSCPGPLPLLAPSTEERYKSSLPTEIPITKAASSFAKPSPSTDVHNPSKSLVLVARAAGMASITVLLPPSWIIVYSLALEKLAVPAA
ncbi:hypothetical protein KCU89_g80, partial [Aureobasidium melanogenum]